MKKFSVKCSCGHLMSCDANDLSEAKTKMKGMMTQEAIDAHLKEFHKPEEPKPTKSEPTLEKKLETKAKPEKPKKEQKSEKKTEEKTKTKTDTKRKKK